MDIQHKNLAAGGWRTLSLAEQMGNIGSEVSRAARAEGKDKTSFENAVLRALELFDLTIDDPRWRNRLREIERAREVFSDAATGGREYQSSLADLENYFLHFALLARKGM